MGEVSVGVQAVDGESLQRIAWEPSSGERVREAKEPTLLVPWAVRDRGGVG